MSKNLKMNQLLNKKDTRGEKAMQVNVIKN